MNIFVFGNGNIRFFDFLKYYERPLRKYINDKNCSFSVCDFRGVDTLIMELLKCANSRVTVYHIGKIPRYLPDKYKTQTIKLRFSRLKITSAYFGDFQPINRIRCNINFAAKTL
jgi:hypothetical protein